MMADDDLTKTQGMEQSGGAPRGGAVAQAEIDDVLSDGRLSPSERMARLNDLRQRMLDTEHADDADAYAPLKTRIMDALSMLAQGGHDYDGSLRVEGENAGGRGDPSDDPANPTTR